MIDYFGRLDRLKGSEMRKRIAKAGIVMIVSVLSAIAGLVSYEFTKGNSVVRETHNGDK